MSQDRPMVLAVLADFGGRRPPGTRRLRRVDRDTLDAVVAGLGVEVEVPDGEDVVSLRLERMEDFRPDSFVRRVPGLSGMLAEPEPSQQADTPVQDPPHPVPPGPSLLDAILDVSTAETSPAREAIQDLARRVAEPSTMRAPRSRPGAADRRLADAVRAVLYSPRFRAVEAAWWGLATLVREAETGEELRVYLLDAAREDAPLLLAEELATPGAPRPSCILAAYTFGASEYDLAVLERFGAVALAAGVPLIADASPGILGLRDARELGDAGVRQRIGLGPGPDAWRAFRALPAATNVTLCLPRVLLRAPYGPAGEQVTTFPFDEALTGRDHERFLWGSAALAYGSVLARGFAAEGWDAPLERYARLDGLPVHVWREGGEECVLPCAEVVMSDATVGRVVEEEVMAVASVRGEDRVTFRRRSALSPVAG
jgi:predicted component of type VI protein secretion system